jgi:ribosome maturation factor RimP
MGNSTRPARVHDVRGVVEPVIVALGLDLEDVEVQASGKRRRVCIVVDRDGGIDLDGIAETSRAVSEALDGSDAMGDQAYTLEVTSPGIDRPLTLPRHWRRNVGRRVRIHLADASTIEGRIRSVDDEGVHVDADGPSGAESVDRCSPWDGLVRGEVQVEFRRPEGEPQAADQEES